MTNQAGDKTVWESFKLILLYFYITISLIF